MADTECLLDDAGGHKDFSWRIIQCIGKQDCCLLRRVCDYYSTYRLNVIHRAEFDINSWRETNELDLTAMYALTTIQIA